MRSVAALFWFSIRQTLWQWKIWPTLLLLAVPSGLAVLVRVFGSASDRMGRYHAPMHLVLLSLVMPLVCLLYGTALLGADIEGRTLVYLVTRRMRRATVVLVRFVAAALALTLLLELAVLAVHACAFAGLSMQEARAAIAGHSASMSWAPTKELAVYVQVVPVGVVSFLAVFSLIGLLVPRPLGVAVVYLVFIEMILSAIPIPAQKYTVMHQLRATMFDAIPGFWEFSDIPRPLVEQLYPAGVTGTTNLVIVTLAALALTCVLATWRELVPGKITRG